MRMAVQLVALSPRIWDSAGAGISASSAGRRGDPIPASSTDSKRVVVKSIDRVWATDVAESVDGC